MPASLVLFDNAGGSFDFSTYLRTAEDDGLNPYPVYREPAFNETPLGEGEVLTSVNERNREMTFRVWVNAANKDTMQALVQSIVRTCRDVRRATWQDDASSAVSNLDVQFARVEPDFKYNHARKCYLACTVRIYCSPPFAHTGTERIIGTAAQGMGFVTVQLPSIGGDLNALPQVMVRMASGASGPAWRGQRRVVIAALPHASFQYLGSFAGPVAGSPSFIGSVFAAGLDTNTPRALLGPWYFGVPSMVGSRTLRIFAAVHSPMTNPGIALTAYDGPKTTPLGPTQLATTRMGQALVDLGVWRPGLAATQAVYIAYGHPSVANTGWNNMGVQGEGILGAAGAGGGGGIGAVFAVPEDQFVMYNLVPGKRELIGYDDFSGLATNYALHGRTDQSGNVYGVPTMMPSFAGGIATPVGGPFAIEPGGPAVYQAPWGMSLPTSPAPNGYYAIGINKVVETPFRFGMQAQQQASVSQAGFGASFGMVMRAIAQPAYNATTSPYLYQARWAAGGSSFLTLEYLPVGGAASTVACVGFAATSLQTYGGLQHVPAEFDFVFPAQNEVAVYARQLSGGAPFVNTLGSAIPFASIGAIVPTTVAKWAALDLGMVIAASSGNFSPRITRWEVSRFSGSQLLGAGDTLVHDMVNGEARRIDGASITRDNVTDRARGAGLRTLSPSTPQLLVLNDIPHGGPIDSFGVEVRARERFTFMR